jgi:hypothetical protein
VFREEVLERETVADHVVPAPGPRIAV